jgi:predicted RNase H-like HicB family nuclease
MTRQEPVAATEERTYAAVYEPCEEGGFVVSFPAFPDLMTQGETLEEARAMAGDLLLLHLGLLRERGAALPASDDDAHRPIREPLTVKLQAA